MDGGIHRAAGDDELSRRRVARAARAAADDEVLAADVPYVAEALERLATAVDELLALRWAAFAAEQVTATVRGLSTQHARLDAIVLAGVKAIDDRDDVVPAGRARTAGARFLQHSLGQHRGAARREAETARLLHADGGDLAAVGEAYAAGMITRGHVDVATSVHRRLHAAVRRALVPVVDPETGEEEERPCIQVVD
jgi:predicted NAD-dependent protein-ADP-ribosyltransferase YbiA (DUF1768 family)